MKITADLIEELLYEEEGPTLDFKRDQYPFAGADDAQKSELLKDILAFANAFRRADAYILIGVDEVKGGRCIVHGVSHHLEDAALQQFVNSKTQRPVEFSYCAVTHDGKPVGVIHIPVQQRPLYLKKKFGPLEAEQVYIRRGSSTVAATPDEVAKMGAIAVQQNSAPVLEFQFADHECREMLGSEICVQTYDVEISPKDNIPLVGDPLGLSLFDNSTYLRELAAYHRKIRGLAPIYFVATNAGEVAALDVKVEIEIGDPEKIYQLVAGHTFPSRPTRDRLSVSPAVLMRPPQRYDTSASRRGDRWVAEVRLGKVQPKGTAWSSDALYIGATQPGSITLSAVVYADNIPTPVRVPLRIDIAIEKERLSVDDVIHLGRKWRH